MECSFSFVFYVNLICFKVAKYNTLDFIYCKSDFPNQFSLTFGHFCKLLDQNQSTFDTVMTEISF